MENKKVDGKNKNKQKKEEDNFDWKRASKTSLVWLMIIFFAVYISGILTESGKKEIEIEYTDYREYLLNKEIQKGVITGNTFHGEFKTPKTIETLSGIQLNDISYFKLKLPFIDRTNTIEWDEANIEYTFKEESIDWTGYLLNMLPWILLIGFWFFMIRRLQVEI